MSVPGTYMGGIRSVEDLRKRCRIDSDTGCWHWGMYCNDTGPRVHFVDHDGKRHLMNGRRAALTLERGEHVPKGHFAFATRDCKSDDCVNPKHCRSSTRANHGQYLRSVGKTRSAAKTAALIITARERQAKLNWDIVRAIRASDESQYVLAARYGVSQCCIWSVIHGRTWQEALPQASVFSFRPNLLAA